MDPRQPREKRRQTEKDVTRPAEPEKQRPGTGSGGAFDQDGEGVPVTPEVGPISGEEGEAERRPGEPDEDVRH